MASIIAKKKANQLYYYVVESARVDGKPRIVHQAYLGTAEKVVALVMDRTAPVPLSAASHSGLPGALWFAPSKPACLDYWRPFGRHRDPVLRRSAAYRWRPSTASVNWGRRPKSPIGMAKPFCIRSGEFRRNDSPRQAFWDAFEKILPEHLDPLATGDDDPLDRAQLRLLDGRVRDAEPTPAGLRHHQLLQRHRQPQHAQRSGPAWAQKQGRHNLRQVGLSYVLDVNMV